MAKDLDWTALLLQDPSEESYEGSYEGPVRPGAGQEVCPAVTVRVEPAEQSLAQGGDTVLTCEGAGQGDSVTWEKVGSDLAASSITVTRERELRPHWSRFTVLSLVSYAIKKPKAPYELSLWHKGNL